MLTKQGPVVNIISEIHLKKLFQAIFKVEFSDDMKMITAFRSLEGEKVDLLSPVEITQTVEEWLANLSVEMVKTLETISLNILLSIFWKMTRAKPPWNKFKIQTKARPKINRERISFSSTILVLTFQLNTINNWVISQL